MINDDKYINGVIKASEIIVEAAEKYTNSKNLYHNMIRESN